MDKETEEIRFSAEVGNTREAIASLIKDNKVNIDVVLSFFNHGCYAYKQASKIASSDAKINIEFNYAARALASYIQDTEEGAKNLASTRCVSSFTSYTQ
jgi:hypothetical protein